MKRQKRTFSGFYFSFIAAILALSGILTVAWSQQTQPGSPAAGAGTGNQVATSSANPSIADYNPTAAYDLRFHVTNIDFYRRYHPSGIGEFLEVALDIQNNTEDPLDLYAYVIAYDEDSAVDSRTRNLIPYPTWRPHDPDKYLFLVNNVNISPVNVS